MGELHLEIITTRINRDYKIPVTVGAPRVAYRQTIAREVDIESRHIKQSGGSGQYAVVNVKFRPWNISGETNTNFVNSIKGGIIPNNFIPAIEKGIVEAASTGGRLGWPFVGVEAELYYGKTHEVDSSELAFNLSAQKAFRDAIEGNFKILEPVMKLVVTVPEEFLGAVVGDLNTRRVAIEEITMSGAIREIRGKVPIAEMFAYSGTIRGSTQGRGSFSMEPCGYQEVPAYVQEKLVKERTK
jgi:elongation factor G